MNIQGCQQQGAGKNGGIFKLEEFLKLLTWLTNDPSPWPVLLEVKPFAPEGLLVTLNREEFCGFLFNKNGLQTCFLSQTALFCFLSSFVCSINLSHFLEDF